MKLTKLFTLMVAGVIACSLMAGCGGGEKKKAAAGGDTIKVGANLEMSGNSASFGQSSVTGAKLAFDQVNAKGGVLGKKIEFIAADNKSEPSEATNAMQKLITKDKVVAIIAPDTSSAAIAAGQVNTAAKVLAITAMGTNPRVTVGDDGKTKEFMFRACFIDPFQGPVMSNFAKSTLKAQKVAILIDNSSDYAKGLAQFFEEDWKKNGGTIVGKEGYLQKDTDFKATLTKINAAKPDMIYIPGYYQEVGMIIKQAREMGYKGPICGGDSWDSPSLPEIAGKANLNNTYFSSMYSPDDTSPLNKQFVADYEKAYKAKPNVFAALTYDAALLIADAIKRAGSADPVKIKDAMAATKGFEGVSGTVTFDAKHNPVKSAVIIGFKDGAQVFKGKVNP